MRKISRMGKVIVICGMVCVALLCSQVIFHVLGWESLCELPTCYTTIEIPQRTLKVVDATGMYLDFPEGGNIYIETRGSLPPK